MDKKIVIAEDEEFLHKVLSHKLEKEGFVVHVATDGQKAIDIVTKEEPDLLLLDLIMPEKNGFEVLEALKGNPKTANVPVVVLSNLGQEEDKEKVKELGAKDYLVKVDIPISDVVKKVYGYLGIKK